MILKKLFPFILLLLSGCGTVSNVNYYFPEEQHPQQSAKLITFKPEIQIRKVWAVKVAQSSSSKYIRLTPAVAHGFIFVPTSSGYIKAIDQTTGKILWRQNVGREITTGVCAKYGKLFIATDNGDVLALDQKTGKLLWKRLGVMSEILATPVAAQKILFVKSMDGSLKAFSQTNGHVIWSYSQSVPSVQMHLSSSPVIYKHYVVAGFANGHLVTLNNQTGAVIWDKMITNPGDFEGIDVSPVIANNTVFAGGYRGKIVALSLKTGDLIWRHSIAGCRGISSDSNNIYITDSKSYVWGFTQDVGALVFRQRYLYYRSVSLAASFKNYVVVGDAFGYLHWISKQDGHFVARTYLDGSPILVKPFVYDNEIFVYTQAGNLYKLRIKN